jgi:hypothetical protein
MSVGSPVSWLLRKCNAVFSRDKDALALEINGAACTVSYFPSQKD